MHQVIQSKSWYHISSRLFLSLTLALLFILTGCANTSTRYVETAPGAPAEQSMSIAEINAAMQGNEARVTMRDGTTREGRILSVETDSLSMSMAVAAGSTPAQTARRFPMSQVHAITRPRRTKPTLIGLGLGFGLGAAGTTAFALSARNDTEGQAGEAIANIATVLVGTILMAATTGIGLLIGGANAQERTYIINP
jgi:uncharacterized membrane protein HdeD (DUF308 family)